MWTILFVCTGNTCRSPMAEALLRLRLAQAGVTGVAVQSAGTAASPGEPVSRNAVLAAAALGADLSHHTARTMSRELVRTADLVLALGPSHHEAVVRLVPDAAERTHMLSRFGPHADAEALGLADPYGGDLATYTHAIHDLDIHLRRILPDIASRAADAAHGNIPRIGARSTRAADARNLKERPMPFDTRSTLWFNGKMVPWNDAQLHVMSHVVHYGSSLFEGIRCYKTPRGPAIFRLDRHIDRLFDSCRIYRMTVPFTREELGVACEDVVRDNHFDECYVRPVVYLGYNGTSLGVDPSGFPVDVAVAAFAWGKYLGPEAFEKGANVCVSSWTRIAPNTLPTLAKSAANYMNSQLIRMEARDNGYDEGIALDTSGRVSEGSGENVFVYWRGALLTPPLASSVLPGITRDCVLTLAADLGIPVREEPIPRELLYIADEVFFTGTAAEISPIATVDRQPVGNGRRGPVTQRMQEAFFAILHGTAPDRYGWLHHVAPRAAAAAPAPARS